MNGLDANAVTIDELLAALRRRKIPIPYDSGTFVALEVCEAYAKTQLRVATDSVTINTDGVVAIGGTRRMPEAAFVKSTLELLASLLVAAGPGVPQSLMRLVETGMSSPDWTQERLHNELDASLVPLNRSAARRVLARLVRDAGKDASPRGGAAQSPSANSEGDLDAALDALLSDAPAPAPAPIAAPVAAPPAPPAPRPTALSTMEVELDEEPAPRLVSGMKVPLHDQNTAPLIEAPPSPAVIVDSFAADVNTDVGKRAQRSATANAEPTAILSSRDDDTDEFENPKRGKGLYVLFAVIAVLAAGVFAVYKLRPDLVARFRGDAQREEAAAHERAIQERDADARRRQSEAAARFGDVSVATTPPGAQVFMFVGRGPAVVEDLPVGVAHEFLALVDGKAPQRVVVPADAEWEADGNSFRYEVAVQTPETDMPFDALDVGETRLARGAPATPRGQMGSVRVVTTPRNAKVFQLVGFSPDVHLTGINSDEVVEFLVALEGHRAQRVVIAPSDWREENGQRAAHLDITLEER